jgi:threonine/homoserine/homoserine lactone efflux protein
VAIAAVFTSVRLAEARASDAAAKVGLLSVLIVVINTAWLLAGASIAPLLRDPRRARAVNLTMAAALVAFTALALVR